MATPQEYLGSLVSLAARFAGPVIDRDQGDALLHVLLSVAMAPQQRGVVLSVATAPVAGTEVLVVSPQVLDDLQYQDQAAYQAALSNTVNPFVHPEDVQIVDDHIRWRSSASYTARLRRGVGNGPNVWRRMEIQGWTLQIPNVGELRLTMLAIAP